MSGLIVACEPFEFIIDGCGFHAEVKTGVYPQVTGKIFGLNSIPHEKIKPLSINKLSVPVIVHAQISGQPSKLLKGVIGK